MRLFDQERGLRGPTDGQVRRWTADDNNERVTWRSEGQGVKGRGVAYMDRWTGSKVAINTLSI